MGFNRVREEDLESLLRPPESRQIYYAFRGPAQDAVGQLLDAQYFTQTLLPAKQADK
jgi:hypothetical protein